MRPQPGRSMRNELVYLKKLVAWSAMILVALLALAAVGAALRPPTVGASRVLRAFVEQVGTFLPFASYAAAFSTGRGSEREGARWALLGGGLVAGLSFALLGLATALANDPPAGPTAAWEAQNRAAHAVFGFVATVIGAIAGRWSAGRGRGAGGAEAWGLGLFLLANVLVGQMVSWTLVLRHAVSAVPAVWCGLLLAPGVLLAAWLIPAWLSHPTAAAPPP